MAKIVSVAVFTVLFLFVLCDAAPRSLDAANLKNLSAIIEPEVPVRYDGAQLWSVDFTDDHTKRIVVELKKRYGSFMFVCFVYFLFKQKKNIFILKHFW